MSEERTIKHFNLLDALKTAEKIADCLAPHCSLLEIAGSIRRRKPKVKDIEIIYVPLIEDEIAPGELNILSSKINKTEEKILDLIKEGVLDYRTKKDGTKSFGERVKLLVHKESSTPVDLFSCTRPQWANNLVSRTGGKQTNITIAAQAKRMGWNWLPFDQGFKHKHSGEIFVTKSEKEVFDFVNLPYLQPWERP